MAEIGVPERRRVLVPEVKPVEAPPTPTPQKVPEKEPA